MLEGDGKGAVNAISVEGMWTLSIPPSTPRTPRLVVNQDKVAEHRHIWQGGLAKARGIRYGNGAPRLLISLEVALCSLMNVNVYETHNTRSVLVQ